MNNLHEFCFCTLALRSKYRLLAKRLAQDLEKYSPGTVLLVGTDEPKDFESCSNIISFKLKQRGILHCYHDRRFVVEKALLKYRSAIMIDADTSIIEPVPNNIEWTPGLSGCSENLVEHVARYTPERLKFIEVVANKLNISVKDALWVGEALMVVTQDGGKEREFIKQWGVIAQYLELNGVHAGQGNSAGLAAAKIGWQVNRDNWIKVQHVVQHLDASHEKTSSNIWQRWTRRFGYHYRLNATRLRALKDFNFYYR